MNSKQAKRLRRNTNKHIQAVLGPDVDIRTKSYDRGLVDSQRYNSTVTNLDGTVTKHKDTAVQIRLTTGSPRQVYKAVKKRVQANRSKKRSRVLPVVRVRPEEATGAVEHTGAERLQSQHGDVYGL